MKQFFYNFIIGILIGFGAILPGVSSGVFCVVFGIYESLICCISNFFKDIKGNLSFLFPIGLGGIVGIVLLGNVIKYFFIAYNTYSCYAFIGLILGTIPALYRQACIGYPKFIDIKKIIPIFLSFLFGIILIIIEKYFNLNLLVSSLATNTLYLIFAGFVMSVGIVVPGISNTVILMCLGVYAQYITAIASINLAVLVPLSIGLFFGCILWIKIIKYLFEKHHQITSFCIIGFILGSVFVLFPGFAHGISGLVCTMLFFISLIISYKLANIEQSNWMLYILHSKYCFNFWNSTIYLLLILSYIILDFSSSYKWVKLFLSSIIWIQISPSSITLLI